MILESREKQTSMSISSVQTQMQKIRNQSMSDKTRQQFNIIFHNYVMRLAQRDTPWKFYGMHAIETKSSIFTPLSSHICV